MQIAKSSKALLLAAVLQGCVTAAIAPQEPPRAGMFTLDKMMDRQKPLATSNYSGWKSFESSLIGVEGGRWLMRVDVIGPLAWRGKWAIEIPSGVSGPITLIEDALYIAERDGGFYKINARDGKILWRTELGHFSYREVIEFKDNVFVVTASQQLYALDRASGKVSWIFDGGAADGLAINRVAAPVVYQDFVIYGIANGDLIAVNTSTGREVWRHSTDVVEGRFHDVVGQIVVKAKTLVLSRYDGQVIGLELSPSQARKVWDEKVSSITTSVYDANRYFIGTHSGDIVAYDLPTGRRLWQTNLGVTPVHFYEDNKSLLVAASNGRINSLNLETGAIEWHDDVQGRLGSEPFKLGKVLYFPTGYQNLYGYKL